MMTQKREAFIDYGCKIATLRMAANMMSANDHPNFINRQKLEQIQDIVNELFELTDILDDSS